MNVTRRARLLLDLGDVAVAGRAVRRDAAVDVGQVRLRRRLLAGAGDARLAVDRDRPVDQARPRPAASARGSTRSRSSRGWRPGARRAAASRCSSGRPYSQPPTRKSEPRSTTRVPAAASAEPISREAPCGRHRKTTSQPASALGVDVVVGLGAGLEHGRGQRRVRGQQPLQLESGVAGGARDARGVRRHRRHLLHEYTDLLHTHARAGRPGGASGGGAWRTRGPACGGRRTPPASGRSRPRRTSAATRRCAPASRSRGGSARPAGSAARRRRPA